SRALRAQGPPPARGNLRPSSLQGASQGLSRRPARRAAVLKAHSKFLEQLMLAGDLALVAVCWVLSYVVRFHVLASPLLRTDIPPLAPYLPMLLPILVVWSVSFHAFGLYRPRRIGSRLSEAADIAKASSIGVLVLVAIMTFFFRGYDYSRVVIL